MPGPNGETLELVFLSRDPEEHHQIVLCSGRTWTEQLGRWAATATATAAAITTAPCCCCRHCVCDWLTGWLGACLRCTGPEDCFNTINQISFICPSLTELKRIWAALKARDDISALVAVTHGTAVSCYFKDPEGNRIELFVNSQFYCYQPIRGDIDLDATEVEIWAAVETHAKAQENFKTRAGAPKADRRAFLGLGTSIMIPSPPRLIMHERQSRVATLTVRVMSHQSE